MELKKHKAAYKTNFEGLNKATISANEATEAADAARKGLVDAFEAWHGKAAATPDGPLAAAVDEAESPARTDRMDNEEEFEQLQMRRVMETAPESLAFVRARKSVRPRKPPQMRR